jgi:hypothetical protein
VGGNDPDLYGKKEGKKPDERTASESQPDVCHVIHPTLQTGG